MSAFADWLERIVRHRTRTTRSNARHLPPNPTRAGAMTTRKRDAA